MNSFSLLEKFNPFYIHGVVREEGGTLISRSFMDSFNKYLLSIHYEDRH